MESSDFRPTGLLCELMEYPEKTKIYTKYPKFGWIVNDNKPDEIQTAYQIVVACICKDFPVENNIVWDSGKIFSCNSINVAYEGPALEANRAYCWRVRTWNSAGNVSCWSEWQKIYMGQTTEEQAHRLSTVRYPLERSEISPKEIVEKEAGHYFIDFGRAAFGTIELAVTCEIEGNELEIHLGEDISAPSTVNRNPKGCIRYRKIILPLMKGAHIYIVKIPSDERNTDKQAVRMPEEIGEVMPFRYCELMNCPSAIDSSSIRQIMIHYPFNDSASSFTCSDETLNRIWDLCKYSIKATSFCGVYVDGDRERIPYEADAYINQLCHYSVDREYTLARYSQEYLLFHPTWPTEWIMHSVFMVWTDYEYTGNSDFLNEYYEDLKHKTLLALAREDGLISTRTGLMSEEFLRSIHIDTELKDIVDWPPACFTEGGYGERDGYEMCEINTVVNAFHYRALILMSKIARVIGKSSEAAKFAKLAFRVRESINAKLFCSEKGIYVDGEGSSHSSLHANMFPLAFGIVPEEYKQSVVAFIKSRGMACSVYGAQFLLEALYLAGYDNYALELMRSEDNRSWWNMLKVGSTITLEAWDLKYKNNLDWNHAWGAGPANIIPRFLVGVRPLEPGFGKILIRPQLGNLEYVCAKIPTIRGDVKVQIENNSGGEFMLDVEIPVNTSVRIELPRGKTADASISVDGKPIVGQIEGNFLVVPYLGSGKHTLIRCT